MMIFQKIVDLIELFRAQYLTMEIIQYFFIVQYIFLCFCQFQKLCEFFFKCNFFLLHSSSFLPSSEPARPFPILLLNTHTCPVTEFAVASHFNTANSCCHHVFLRHFRFQKCLPVYSNPIFPNPQSLQRNYERRQSRLFPYEPLQLIQIRRPPDLIVEAVLLDPAHRLRKCLFLLLIV